MLSKLIPGGEIRIVRKGEKASDEGKPARSDFIMVKAVSMAKPLFIDERMWNLMKVIQHDEDVKGLITEWAQRETVKK